MSQVVLMYFSRSFTNLYYDDDNVQSLYVNTLFGLPTYSKKTLSYAIYLTDVTSAPKNTCKIVQFIIAICQLAKCSL